MDGRDVFAYQVAWLCQGLDAGIRTIPATAPLIDRLVAELRPGGDVAAPIGELDRLLRGSGVAGGLAAYGDSDEAYAPPAGVGDGHPVEETWVCPLDRCMRVELVSAGPGPRCGLGDRPMRRMRLRP
jgi:hypothetical protein